ncbi:MAG: hypothetical protein QXK37_04230 [Candidatus Woesearchaeota archaeon]
MPELWEVLEAHERSSKAEVKEKASSPFWLCNGKPIPTIKDLLSELRMMNEEIFRAHVTPEKNDFASWIRHTWNESGLATLLDASKSRKEHIQILSEFIGETKRRHSNIKPDLDFLRRNFIGQNKGQNESLETKRRIKPKELTPDFSFIRLTRDLSRELMHEERISKKEEQRLSEEMVGIKNNLEELDKEVERRREELSAILKKINEKERGIFIMENEIQKRQFKILEEMKKREKILLDEFEKLEKFEELLHRKRMRIMTLEKRIFEKHKHYIKRKTETDLRRISTLNEKSEINKYREILSMIEEVKKCIQHKKYKEAKAMIQQIKEQVSSSNISPEHKKHAYYSLLELGTEIDLETLK